MTMQFLDSLEEPSNFDREASVGFSPTFELTESDVHLLADKIVEKILKMGQKSISKKKIEKMVDCQLKWAFSKEDGFLHSGDRRSCSPNP